jgi:hypothetical protein
MEAIDSQTPSIAFRAENWDVKIRKVDLEGAERKSVQKRLCGRIKSGFREDDQSWDVRLGWGEFQIRGSWVDRTPVPSPHYALSRLKEREAGAVRETSTSHEDTIGLYQLAATKERVHIHTPFPLTWRFSLSDFTSTGHYLLSFIPSSFSSPLPAYHLQNPDYARENHWFSNYKPTSKFYFYSICMCIDVNAIETVVHCMHSLF